MGPLLRQGSLDGVHCIIWILVFPNSHRGPTFVSKQTVCIAVTANVIPELLSPEFGVLLGLGPVIRTRMPEASIYEHGHLRASED